MSTIPSQIEPPAAVIHCDRALAQRLELAEGRSNAEFVEARAIAFPEVDCVWTKVAGALAMFDGAESPCTQTFGLGLFDEVTNAHLETIEQFFRQRGADVYHEVSPLANASTVGLLNERGYRPCELSTVLVRSIRPELMLDTIHNDSLSVREIATDEHELWARIAAAGWADAEPGLEDFILSLSRVNPFRPQSHCFLARNADADIAAGAIAMFDGVALLAGACTVPRWRRQGAQLALLEMRLRFAAERGCDIAMMVAAPGSASQRNAERQGFRVAYTRTKWRLPTA
jgi:GNAT superfamily N-acetyltransferase